MNQTSRTNAIENERLFRSISYALVFLMMTCLVMTIGNLMHAILPEWHSGLIAGILSFIVIDRLYTYQHLKSLTPLSSEWAIALGAQWIVIALFSRFLLSYANGPAALLRDLSFIGRGYITVIFAPEFVITLLLALTTWYLPAQFLQLLDEIGLDMKVALREDAPIQSEAVPAHQRMVNLILTTGILLVILTALTRLNLRNVLSNANGLPNITVNRFSGAEAGAVLYFVFGLALLSLSRLMSLQIHWNLLRIPVSSKNLPRQWAIYSLVFVLVLAMFVSLLPAGDSLGFFSVVATLFSFLVGVFVFLAQLLLALVLLLFSLPFFLLGKAPPFRNGIGSNPFPTLPPAGPEVPMTNSAVWVLIRSIFLWGSLIAILLFALMQFVRQHDELLHALRKSRLVNWLILAWQWLYRNVGKTRMDIARAVTEGWNQLRSRWEGIQILPRPAWINVRALDPRRRVYFFYLAMIRRGAEQGLTREPSQTPSEYAIQLEKSVPAATEDIESITEAFVEARYSRQEVDTTKADIVKATWERIRRALQNRSNSDESANE